MFYFVRQWLIIMWSFRGSRSDSKHMRYRPENRRSFLSPSVSVSVNTHHPLFMRTVQCLFSFLRLLCVRSILVTLCTDTVDVHAIQSCCGWTRASANTSSARCSLVVLFCPSTPNSRLSDPVYIIHKGESILVSSLSFVLHDVCDVFSNSCGCCCYSM